MKLLQLNKLSDEAVESLAESFDRLPHTDHKDGQYRLRRYSVVEVRTTFWNAKEEMEVTKLEHRRFMQDATLNKHQGGMKRDFEEIEDSVIKSEGMKEMCLAFKRGNKLIDGQEVDIHQMRVKTVGDGLTPVAPEGVHQDGFDCIAMIGINRLNLSGGALLIYESASDRTAFLEKELAAGEMIMIRDDIFWHNARDVWPLNRKEQGYGDWFILCAKK
jgi:hypothetical protein